VLTPVAAAELHTAPTLFFSLGDILTFSVENGIFVGGFTTAQNLQEFVLLTNLQVIDSAQPL